MSSAASGPPAAQRAATDRSRGSSLTKSNDGEVGELRELETELAIARRGRRRRDRGSTRAGQLCGGSGLGERVVGAVRRRRSALRWTGRGERPDPDSSISSRDRGGSRSDSRRSLRCWVEIELVDPGCSAPAYRAHCGRGRNRRGRDTRCAPARRPLGGPACGPQGSTRGAALLPMSALDGRRRWCRPSNGR